MQINKIFSSLTGKLVLAIGTLMVVGTAIFWYFLINYQEKESIKSSVSYGRSFMGFVEKSTQYGMLTNQKPLIQHTIESISSGEGVKRIRIFEGKGKIAYSSDKEEIGAVFTKDESMCMFCHSETKKPLEMPNWSIKKDRDGKRFLNIVQPVYNQQPCYSAACHIHKKNTTILGFIESDISLNRMDTAIMRQEIAMTAYVLVFICVLSVVLWAILWRLVHNPLNMLTQGMKRVSAGELDFVLDITTKDEIGELANVFNTMTTDLSKAKLLIIEWGNTLEKKVAEKTKEIQKTQEQLVHSEKLASLGRMAAGVAHEINSPLTGIVTFGHLLLKKFPHGSQEKDDVEVIIEQANRCSSIIKGLLGFSRGTYSEKTIVNINDILNTTLHMVKHRMDFFDIKLLVNLADALPPVKADASQIQQVFLNIILNAADAMEGKGTLTINTRKVVETDGVYAEIEFTDTGSGISDKDLAKLFEPFFTTKPVGKGTGLGLAVSHGIIQDHGGRIHVRTSLGKGTSFFVRIPVQKDEFLSLKSPNNNRG
ncbi:MAG: HAMP domain-containing protein [Nitrospiraceae bacterium]|nr:HAMP domain-containing protein [Nitrospiraceae bacterium]